MITAIIIVILVLTNLFFASLVAVERKRRLHITRASVLLSGSLLIKNGGEEAKTVFDLISSLVDTKSTDLAMFILLYSEKEHDRWVNGGKFPERKELIQRAKDVKTIKFTLEDVLAGESK